LYELSLLGLPLLVLPTEFDDYVFEYLHRTRPYDLRHTFATLMLEQGENPKVVQEALGHSRIAHTMDTYSHVSPNIQREAFGRLGKRLKGTRGSGITVPVAVRAGRSGPARKAKALLLLGFWGALGTTRTCDLLIRSLIWHVLTGSIESANLARFSRKSGFVLCVLTVLFSSVLSLLLPRCCPAGKVRSSSWRDSEPLRTKT
jgi:hypothetical protein